MKELNHVIFREALIAKVWGTSMMADPLIAGSDT